MNIPMINTDYKLNKQIKMITENIAHNDGETAMYNIVSFLLYPDESTKSNLAKYIDEIIEETKLLSQFNNVGLHVFGKDFTAENIIGSSDFFEIITNLLKTNVLLKQKTNAMVG